MEDFTTIFEVTVRSNNMVGRTFIGYFVFIAGLVGLVFHKKSNGAFPSKPYIPLAMSVWALGWLFMYVPDLQRSKSEIEKLVDIHRSDKCSIVEGVVSVINEQPYEGHAPADKISIEGAEFEINRFSNSPGYRQTIAHKGVLRSGVYARLHHHNGTILQVEVKN